MLKNYFSLTLLIVFFCSSLIQAKQITVRTLPLVNQLPSNSVQRVFQDKEGFMWFGTMDGVCRYDAYRMLVFRSDKNNPNLLTSNEITCFAEDNNGHLLIGTKKGLNILDKKTYRINHFDGEELKDLEIKCMLTPSDGSIWIGAGGRVLRYDKDMLLQKRYDTLPINSVNCIYEDNDANLWIAIWRNGLYKYDRENDSFIKYPKIGFTDNPFRIFQDNRKQHWVCTWGDGIYLFNPEKGEEQMYSLQHMYNKERQLSEGTFFSIVQDDKYGYIWAMSISGIYAMEYDENGNLKTVDTSSLFKETNNIFSEIVKDKIGNLWIGTFSEGVLTINFDKPVIQNYRMKSIKDNTGITPNITAIYADANGDIWINQNRWGPGIFYAEEGVARFYKDFMTLRDIPTMNIISNISDFRSIPGKIWLAPENEAAIYVVRKINKSIELLEKIDLQEVATNSGNPRMFFEDRKNNIWIVTANGLLVKPYNKEKIVPVSFSLGHITGITEDTRGDIWISSKNDGVFQISVSGNLQIDDSQIKNYNRDTGSLSSNNVESICGDINGKVWMGTKEGSIIVYDVISRQFSDMSESFKTLGEGILNLIADDFGHIWMSTNKRITEYNPANGASRDYSVSDGVLVNSFLQNSYYKDKSGRIFFGGNRGISVFTPSEKLSEQPKKTKTLITDVKINNQSVFHGNNNSRFDAISQFLVFEPNDKNIEIDFSSLDYTFPGKIRYAYKMEGVDDDWVYTENDRQFAIYNQLGRGSYVFKVKATDENRQWSSEITQLKIYKQPAFYETWWAYTIYTIILLVSAYFAVVITKNRIKLRNKLKIAQIEKDKSEELTQTKLRYFTNISHDFLTPLTIISCLIDDAEITYKGKITQFDTMRSNVNRLRRLLQQVLDFRKVESGNMKLKISQGDIVAFIRDICYTHFLPLMKKKNIQFTFSANLNQIPAYFDADKIDKIVFNMLSNAFKYTPEGGSVKIELNRYIKNDHPHLIIRISDTGMGIAKEDLNNIFKRFYNNKMADSGDTNGIGLSLTKDLLDIHHGTIMAESEVNVGTVFTIDIPIDKESYNDSEMGKSDQVVVYEKNIDLMMMEEETTIDNNPEKEKINVLLVEDNEELLSLMNNILSKHYHVFTADNGTTALTIVKDNNIDIIISDVMMPEMDGLELCRILKKDLETSHIPIILLTAKNSADDRIECYNAGADGYISKPFELKVLEARINNFISNKKNKQQEFKTDVEINISTLEYPTIDEQFLNNAISVIEEYLSESDFDVNTFAERLNMSKSSLYRKIKTMTGLSPIEFIRNIRLKHACQMLKDQAISISEVAYSVGFSDPKYFTSCFKGEFNMTPSEYQKSV